MACLLCNMSCDEDYDVITSSRKKSVKGYHVNLLKPYYENETKSVTNQISVHSVLSYLSVSGGKVSLFGEEEETISPDDCVPRSLKKF